MTVHPLSHAMRTTPLWTADTLGKAIPDSAFAVSVSLPRWEDVIGYEERDPRVVNAMAVGYPRFFIHPAVARLGTRILAESGDPATEGCLLFPSHASATRCADFIHRLAGVESRVEHLSDYGVFAVFHPLTAADAAKEFWQHCGEGLSGRHAVATENETVSTGGDDAALREVTNRLASIYGVPASAVHLFPTGMSAIWASFRTLRALRPDGATVQFGFPYVDTLKLHETAIDAHQFLPIGDADDLDRLKTILATDPVTGVFCEVPSNPLLRTPDLRGLRQMTAQRGVPLVVDDTLAAFFNLDVLPHCDLIACSLTKYFSGVGDVMGGALVVNPNSTIAAGVNSILAADDSDGIYAEDLHILAERSRTVETRVGAINNRAEALAKRLAKHPAVATVNYPSRQDPDYAGIMRPEGGLGGLLSFTLRNPAAAQDVFDALPFCKGPNLGMDYTLCCPFTILAHYDELDFAKRCGLDPDLIRVAVGTEELDVLLDGFDCALKHG